MSRLTGSNRPRVFHGPAWLKSAAATVGVLLLAGCHTSSHYWVLRDVSVDWPAMTDPAEARDRAGLPGEWLDVSGGGASTLFVAAELKDNPEAPDDEAVRTFVVRIDGPLEKGETYEVTPDNGRVIVDSTWYPARQPYAGVEGRVEITDISDEGVSAYCVLRNVLRNARADSYILRGWLRFKPPLPADTKLRRSLVRYREGG